MNSQYVFDMENPERGSLETIEHSLVWNREAVIEAPGGGGRSAWTGVQVVAASVLRCVADV